MPYSDEENIFICQLFKSIIDRTFGVLPCIEQFNTELLISSLNALEKVYVGLYSSQICSLDCEYARLPIATRHRTKSGATNRTFAQLNIIFNIEQ